MHRTRIILCVLMGALLSNAGGASVAECPLRWQVGEPIATYYAGPTVTDPVARQMKEGGFNLVWCSEQEMDTARRHGLRVLLRDPLLQPETLDDPGQLAKLDALIGRVKNHPSLYAYWIIDEPGAALFPGLGRLVAHLRARDPVHLADINLFPTYANNDQLGVKGDTETAYREYLRQFIETVKPELLSYDHYHFAVGHDTDQYFLNLGMIRRAALDAGIPFLNIVQGCTWDPGMRVPNGDEMRWLNYTSLAYGAQGLSYYVYGYAGHEGGMARADGTITPQYEAARVLNREFVATAAQLQPLQSLGAYHVGKAYRGAEPLPASSPFRLDAEVPRQDPVPADGILLGCFGKPGDDGKPGRPTHALVVNLNYRSEVRTAVTGPAPLEVFDPLQRAWKRTDGPCATLSLPPGGGVLVRAREVHSVNAAPSEYPSTDHFWYRLPPADRYIDSQRGSKAFAYADGMLFLSEDNGRTWPRGLAFPDAGRITFSHILENGNIVFATSSKLFLSTDRLKSYREITVKAQDGSDYLPHAPQKPENPGWYFHTLPGEVSWDVGGREMMVWGNYCNVLGGAAPVNIYYSTDSGRTVKIAYAFGRNPHFRDDGSPGGGATGTMLGNPDNPVVARHVHTVAYNPVENAFYACTGDHDRGSGHECHWLRGTYDAKRDLWDWKVLVSTNSNSRYKCGGLSFVDGLAYWISDANGERNDAYGPLGYDRGIFRCAPADIADPAKHTLLYNPEVESGNMIIQDGLILASHCCPASPMNTGFIVSADMGKTWAQYDLKELGKRSPTRFHGKNSEGWFRVDLRTGWIQQAEVLFIKPRKASPVNGG